MQRDRASLTASIVALARRAGTLPRPVARALGLVSFGLVDHVTLRAKAIDAVVATAAARGVTQVVILGAGLDDRAHRMSELATSQVFEVDHPATQDAKRARAGSGTPAARDLVLVGVDFEQDDLGAALASAGHDHASPTTWIWEGVTPYLTRDAIEATLDVVSARSSEGSVVAMTYGTPELASAVRWLHPLVRPAFRALGEPLRGLLSPGEPARLVTERGFRVEADSDSQSWAARSGVSAGWNVIRERLLVCTR
jgi:methyltransferase (TIGR00027 family)